MIALGKMKEALKVFNDISFMNMFCLVNNSIIQRRSIFKNEKYKEALL